MKASAVPTQASEAVDAASPCLIEAVDLTSSPGSRGLWRRRAGVSTTAPAVDRPSPMGFLLTERDEPGAAPSSLHVRLSAPGAEPAAAAAAQAGRFARPVQTVRIKRADAADGDLILTIGPAGAQVVASAATWN